jgi:hypothetical protein
VSEPQYVAATLAWCNARRAENGEPPLNRLPSGRPQRADSCPCGAATGLRVYDRHFSSADVHKPYVAENGKPLPRVVQRFVRAFDRGDLPQYDVGRAT